MTNAVEVLKAERGKLAQRITVLDKAIAVLGGGRGTKKRKMSAATRRKIAAAQRKRWKEKKAAS